jgi:hypothetical protein
MVTNVALPFVAVYNILKGFNIVVIASKIVISKHSFIMTVRVRL